jgi:hypothetical protein
MRMLCTDFLFGWLVADGWCWFVLREEYCWLVAAGCWWLVRSERRVLLVGCGWLLVAGSF